MAATTMTFERVEQIFEELYEELREESGENAPNSYTYLYRTFAELRGDEGGRGSHDETVGRGQAVTWVRECQGPTVARIGAEATGAEVKELLRRYMGVE